MTPAFVVFLLFWLVGVVGTFIPVVPATLIILLGTFVATFMNGFHPWPDLPILLTFTLVTVAISLVDNLASAWGARRYGGSRQAGWGALAGGLVGIFLPFGLLVGPLAGALLVELLWVRRPFLEALRARLGHPRRPAGGHRREIRAAPPGRHHRAVAAVGTGKGGAVLMSELPVLTLYSRRGCHLCEDAENALKSLGWDVQTVDVDSDPALKASYGFDVPVLAAGGQVVLKGVITQSRLLRWRATLS